MRSCLCYEISVRDGMNKSKEPLKAHVRFDGKEFDYVDGENTLPKENAILIKTIVNDYEYLL